MDDQLCPLLSSDHSDGQTYVDNQNCNNNTSLKFIVDDQLCPYWDNDSSNEQAGVDFEISNNAYTLLNPIGNQDLFYHMHLNKTASFQQQPYISPVNLTAQIYSFKIIYVDFPKMFFKKQIRLNNRSMQRIADGNIHFLLDFGTVETMKDVKSISVKVKRTQDNLYSNKQIREFCIESTQNVVQKTKVSVKLDLDSIYEVDGYKVYELEKSFHSDQKQFHLKIEVGFVGNYVVMQNTHSFVLAGRKKIKGDEKRPRLSTLKAIIGNKRTYSSSFTSDVLLDEMTTSGSLSSTSPSFSYSFCSRYKDSKEVIQCSKMIAKHIETNTLHIEQLSLGSTIQTSNGDIAYHWPLENQNERFEEGEVVGFIADENGKYVLKKLTFLNCREALLKGVISRSYYLQAQVPKDGRRSETICLMGIVPVQVKGSVCINDALYASPNFPGFAISSYHLTGKELRGGALIGYAFSSHRTDDELAEGMVQAGVSVLESVSQCMQDMRLQKLEEGMEHKFEAIRLVQKKSKKCTYICFGVFALMVALACIMVYEYFTPGSKLRYAICRMGSLKGTAQFYFVPKSNPNNYAEVNGIEFKFLTLISEKTNHHWYKKVNETGFLYYLNLDRCAFGSLRNRDIVLNNSPVYGAEVFAIDEKCKKVYYYDEPNDEWQPYKSASAIMCLP